jgi:hypothetical protein
MNGHTAWVVWQGLGKIASLTLSLHHAVRVYCALFALRLATRANEPSCVRSAAQRIMSVRFSSKFHTEQSKKRGMIHDLIESCICQIFYLNTFEQEENIHTKQVVSKS